jgi:hypothetical protein
MRLLSDIGLLKQLGFASFLLLSCVSQSFSQMSQSSELAVSGRVTLNGRALSGVTVLAWRQPHSSPDAGTSFSAKTNSDGQYELKLHVGSYCATVRAPGFYEVENGKFSRTLRSITVTNDDLQTALNFEMERGGAITGKVINADGQPLIEATVNLISVDPPPPPLMSARTELPTAQTDDRGIYRIFGANPGRYVLSVGEALTAYNGLHGRPLYARTFYTGTPDQSKATVLTVAPGNELKGVDLKVPPPEKGFSISARVIDEETEQPVVNIDCSLIIIVNGSISGGINRQNLSNQKGICTIENVPAGRYRISIPSSGIVRSGTTPNYYGESNEFDVADQDINGIVLKAKRGATISGVVALDGKPDKKTQELLQKLYFHAATIGVGLQIIPKGFTLKEDGSFFVDGLPPGKLYIGGTVLEGITSQFALLRIELQGIEQKEPIMVGAGEQIKNLRMVYVHATGSIRGTVKFTNSALPSNLKGMALLYRDEKAFNSGIVDSRGQFLVEAVPAGIYKLVVNVGNDGPQKINGRVEQTVEVTDGKATDVIALIEPKFSP